MQTTATKLHQSVTPQTSLKFLVLFMVAILLSIHSGLRGEFNDLDAVAYFGWYAELEQLDLASFFDRLTYRGLFYDDGLNRFETGFALLGFLSVSLGLSSTQFFFACATFSVFVKVSCFFKYFRNSIVLVSCIAWYVCWQYLLMEMNAVRIGLALSIVLLGFRHFAHGSTRALFFIMLASLFHVSAIVLTIFIALIKYPASRKSFYLYILGFSIFLGYMPTHELIYLVFGGFQKISTYYWGLTEGKLFNEINRFNVMTLLRLFLFGIFLYLYRPLQEPGVSRLGFYGLWLSLCCYFAFSSLPVLAGRLSELFGFFSVFAIGGFLKRVRPVVIFSFFVLLVSFLQFYAIVFHSRLVNFFYFINIPFLSVELIAHTPP